MHVGDGVVVVSGDAAGARELVDVTFYSPAMNRQWMREQLEAFSELVDRYLQTRRAEGGIGNKELRQQLFRAEATTKKILHLLEPTLAENIDLGPLTGPAYARNQAQRALGILDDMDEWATNLAPDSPTLRADQFHPWVWTSASTLWDSKHYRAAVHAAATAINAYTQTKVGRTDIADTELMNAVLTDKPKPGQVFLQLPGDPNDQTIKTRNRALRPYAEGCFAGIRNPAAHQHAPEWDEQMALEYLAAFSILARWIDGCVVKHAT
ncbi:MAG TPA: TIGR02391 family protein [Actinophytocola sp.]|uniref:TIGR02391 family protein n=1 Tax=Actinophytocola sp. TaxID=1872138 RepID=UPI002DBD9A91|nr:TIGR02391 family protein [Actinophytocola sp.]HEU5475671.1 TIGR02391 family protein [Actinophytocola sp.]